MPCLDLPKEENPFLGCRGIRLCFQHEVLTREQFEALMRASRGRDFSVMFPMVNNAEEFQRARRCWEDVRSSLVGKGIPVSSHIKLGVMVETPLRPDLRGCPGRSSGLCQHWHKRPDPVHFGRRPGESSVWGTAQRLRSGGGAGRLACHQDVYRQGGLRSVCAERPGLIRSSCRLCWGWGCST